MGLVKSSFSNGLSQKSVRTEKLIFLKEVSLTDIYIVITTLSHVVDSLHIQTVSLKLQRYKLSTKALEMLLVPQYSILESSLF